MLIGPYDYIDLNFGRTLLKLDQLLIALNEHESRVA